MPAGVLCRCSARATNSLPVPDSPVTTAVRSQLAAVSIWRASSCIAGESPIMPTLLSFDSEFTFLFPPGEICDLLVQFTSDKRALVTRSSFGYQRDLFLTKNGSLRILRKRRSSYHRRRLRGRSVLR